MPVSDAESRMLEGQIGAPHCDAQVLHAPGTCQTCDRFPTLQRARELWGIRFTGEGAESGKEIPCPATMRRGLDTIEAWPGNRPDEARAPVGDSEASAIGALRTLVSYVRSLSRVESQPSPIPGRVIEAAEKGLDSLISRGRK